MATSNSQFSILPAPPKGQTGVNPDQFAHLPPPPKGKTGINPDQFTTQPTPKSPDTSVGFAGTKIAGETLGLVSEAKPLAETSKQGQSLQDELDQRLKRGEITQERYNQLSKGLQPDISTVVPKRTTGDIVRGGIKAGTDIASLEVGGAGLEDLAANTAKGAITKGAISGAVAGGLSGGLQGSGQGLESKKTLAGTIKGGLTGAAAGAVSGAAVGAIAPKVGTTIQKITSKKSPENLLEEALFVTKPTLNKKSAVSALQRAGLSGGAEESGALGTAGVSSGTRDKQIAESVAGIVKKNATPIANNTAINNEISRISEDEIRPALEANPKAFNTNQIRSKLNKIEMPVMFKTDPQLEKIYDLVKETALKVIQEHPQTSVGLWDARIAIDKQVQKQFGAAIFNPEKSTAVKESVTAVRHAINDYISESYPEFTDQMSRLSNMYEARSRIANANYKEIIESGNKITRWMKANPKKAKAAGLTGTAFLGDKLYHLLF